MDEAALRNALLGSIDGGQAYMPFEEAIANFPPEHYNTRPPNVPYSFWHLLEHIRLHGAGHRRLHGGRAPTTSSSGRASTGPTSTPRPTMRPGTPRSPGSGRRWPPCGAGQRSGHDLTALARHAGDNQKHTIAREILVTTDHNAYHTGEFAILRQVMGLWPEGHVLPGTGGRAHVFPVWLPRTARFCLCRFRGRNTGSNPHGPPGT